MPLGVDLMVETACNFQCIYCKKYDLGDERRITKENYELFAEKFFPKILYLKLASGGEHFLHKDFAYFLQTAKRYGVNVFLNTNGSLLNDENIDIVMKNNVKILGISLDGGNKETAERIRKGLDFDKLIESIKNIQRIKKEKRLKYPILTVNYAVMKSNIEQLPDFIDLMKEIGVEQVRVMFLYINSFMDGSESLFLYPDLVRKYFPIIQERADANKIKLLLPKLPDAPSQPGKCYWPYHALSITPNGNLAFCCRAWDEKVMGNIFEQDFTKEIWNSKQYQTLRKTVNSKKPAFKICQNCTDYERDTDVHGRYFENSEDEHLLEYLKSKSLN